ncbi:hypothetical protein OK006_1962 [Actinobacteria bacterium OK006]|nr:hypothetical protein OK006_1962 [Actinobacteria bacterium OK006]
MECRDACSHAVLTVRRNVLPESTVRCAPPVIMTSSSSPATAVLRHRWLGPRALLAWPTQLLVVTNRAGTTRPT